MMLSSKKNLTYLKSAEIKNNYPRLANLTWNN